MVEIARLTKATDGYFTDICRLLSMLHGERTSTYAEPEYAQLEAQVADPNIVTVVALDNGRIVGMALLFIHSRVGERSGHVEDVVVDEAYRGQGIGTKLMRKIIDLGKETGLRHIELTARPEREAANHIYEKLGFVKRTTNVRRLRY